ncbi:hypothetical protein E2562_013741 [Oryza meyeriana var. granulata]|uniref:Uncharacterized protein n=1 Tax=Oryza meyeriana var. granulata TaxID=110450 RepID=A0A6G1BJS7_9ORYZ|nr:hypothetical protein E2562_013741 [Oryza meyeriana var. granulata]
MAKILPPTHAKIILILPRGHGGAPSSITREAPPPVNSSIVHVGRQPALESSSCCLPRLSSVEHAFIVRHMRRDAMHHLLPPSSKQENRHLPPPLRLVLLLLSS